jgi:hypothetical protein
MKTKGIWLADVDENIASAAGLITLSQPEEEHWLLPRYGSSEQKGGKVEGTRVGV